MKQEVSWVWLIHNVKSPKLIKSVQGKEFMVAPLDDKSIYWENVNNPEDRGECKKDGIYLSDPMYLLLDEWDDTTVVVQNAALCTCDLFTVIMRVGCQCGGR